VTLDLADDFLVVDNLEDVTYFVKTSDGATPYPTGVDVADVLRRATDKSLLANDKSLARGSTVFHMWTANLGDITPKVNDRVEDADTTTWTVKTVELQTLGTRYKLTCAKEVS
jgi:hypothetical protein